MISAIFVNLVISANFVIFVNSERRHLALIFGEIETKIDLFLLEVKMDELEEKTKIGMKNSNSALWQDNDQRVGRVEMVQKQVQNQLESLLNKSSADQNVLSTLATEVMKTAQKSSFVIFAIITKKKVVLKNREKVLFK